MKINAEALRAIRLRSGHTQSGLAKLADLDRTQLNHLEGGRRNGTPSQIRQLADALKVPLAAITRFDEFDGEAA